MPGNGKAGSIAGILTTVISAIGILVSYILWSTSRDEVRNTSEQARAEIIAARIIKLEVVVEDLRETVRELKFTVERASNDAAHRQLHDVPR